MNKWSGLLGRFGAYGFFKELVFFEPFLILFLRGQGLSFFAIGVLIATRELTTTLAEIPTGVAADLWGRRRALVASFASFILSFLFFYFSRSFAGFFLAMMWFGLGEAYRSGTHKAMILEYLDLRPGEGLKAVTAFAFVRAWSQIGAALSAVLAAAFVFWQSNYRVVFLASVWPYIFGGLLVMTYPRELDGERARKGTWKAWWQFTVDSTRHFFEQPALRLGLINSALDKTLYKTSKDYLQPVIAASALGLLPFLPGLLPRATVPQVVAVAAAVIYLGLYLGSALASSLSGKMEAFLGGEPRALNRTYFGYLAAFLTALLALPAGWWWAVVAAFWAISALQNARRPMILSYLGLYMERSERATMLSVETVIQTLMTMVLAPVIGALVDAFGLGAVFAAGVAVFGLAGWVVRLRAEGPRV
ncbi:MAG: MFS transporter [candidate division FCPU426 bacterium]